MSLSETARSPRSAGIARPLRLGTLVGLRWLAIAGQFAGVFVVGLGLGFPLPLLPSLVLIGISAALNVWLAVLFGAAHRLSAKMATLQLAYDSLQLGGLLALTGGLTNPFSLLLLAPVSVSATTLPQRSTLLLAGLSILIASFLGLWHLPLPWDPAAPIAFHRVYLIGIWVSIVCGVVFVAAYTNRVAHEARQLADALTATELALSRREQLSALDGLAAAAAHELGTPLSTITLAATEMLDDIPQGPIRDDVELIISQSARCRAILGKLRNLGADSDDPFASVPVGDLLAEVARLHDGQGKSITITRETAAGAEPILRRSVGLLYGLGNLVENAVSFAASGVTIRAGWDKTHLSVSISDDGPGFPADLMARLGEPYITTRGRDQQAGEGGGLGLGIFIAKTLLERTGARLSFRNTREVGHARVDIVWPRRVIEVS